MLQFTARDARHFGEASQVLVSPHDYPQCAAWRAGVTVAVRALFAADRALLLVSVQPDLAPGARMVAGMPHDAWWPAIAPASTEFALQDSARRPGVRSEGRSSSGRTGEGRTACRGWPPAVPLPLLSSTLRPAQDVTAAGFGVSLPAWAWVHLEPRPAGGGALLIVGSFGALSARFNETDALLLGAMLRPAFVAGVRDAHARWGPCWGALGNASRPITGGRSGGSARLRPRSRRPGSRCHPVMRRRAILERPRDGRRAGDARGRPPHGAGTRDRRAPGAAAHEPGDRGGPHHYGAYGPSPHRARVAEARALDAARRAAIVAR